jgi:hypothetical protein
LGWATVEHFELAKKKPSSLSIGAEKVRSAEKDLMSFEKDLRSVNASKAGVKSVGKYKNVSAKSSGSKDGDGDGDGAGPSRKRKSRFEPSSSGSKSAIVCYRCFKEGHKADRCPNPKKK